MKTFDTLRTRTFSALKPKEHLTLNLSSETSQFIRVNGAKVRQIGTVQDATLELAFVLETPEGLKKTTRSLTVQDQLESDWDRVQSTIAVLRKEAAELPLDPFAQLPRNLGSSETRKKGKLLDVSEAVDAILEPARALDIAGIYAAGPVLRAMANSAGQSHWFETETYSFDYSVYTPSQRAIKGTIAGQEWDQTQYRAEIASIQQKLAVLDRPAIRVERGAHRTYLAPAAVGDIVAMFSWGCASEAAIRQGDSPLKHLRSGAHTLSPLMHLSEDFSGGESPRFNSEGELSPEKLDLIRDGKLVHTLVNSRSAKEYGVTANGANAGESLRAACLAAGTLAEGQILSRLGKGLYLSNLHYLNWSDQSGGRITGMTRYACFWVEKGEIVAPIENLRWDDTLFRLLGSELEALTVNRSYHCDTGTYLLRNLGGTWMPGALLKSMNFTL